MMTRGNVGILDLPNVYAGSIQLIGSYVVPMSEQVRPPQVATSRDILGAPAVQADIK
jgi:hypothetical protein